MRNVQCMCETISIWVPDSSAEVLLPVCKVDVDGKEKRFVLDVIMVSEW